MINSLLNRKLIATNPRLAILAGIIGFIKFASHRLLLFCLFIPPFVCVHAGYEEGSSFVEGVRPSKKSLFSKDALANVPGYKDSNSHGLDNEGAIDSQAGSAMQNSEAGQFLMDAANRDSKFDISEQDAIMLSADRAIANPLKSVSETFNGKVKRVKVPRVRREVCEESGEPSLVSCKYLLKAVPYYGERSCSEQHERAIESCENTLTVTPQYKSHICESRGLPIIHKSIIELKLDARPVVMRTIYKRVLVDRIGHRGGKSHGKRVTNAYVVGQAWESHPIGQEMLHPSVKISWPEYRKTAKIERIAIGQQKFFGARKREMRHTGWNESQTKDQTRSMSGGFVWTNPSKPHANIAACSATERCIDRTDKTYYGAQVSMPCWKKEITYSCRYHSKNNCKTLLDKGCSQSYSVCLKMVEGVCVNYQKTFDCFTGFSDSWSGCESFVGRSLCRLEKEDVLEGKTAKFIAGKDVARDCWKKKISYSCAYPAPNDCEALRLPSCKQIKEKCLKTVNGACVVMGRTYKCVDGVDDGGYTTNCHDLEKKALQGICERVSQSASAKSGKLVEGFKHEGVWERTSVFKCQHPSKNNCAALIATGCKVKSTRCKKKVSGTCVVWEKELICGGHMEDSSSITGAKVLGLGGELRGADDINDSNIGESIAQLTAAREVGKSGAGFKNPSIFTGSGMKCRWGPTGANNCCKINGWGQSIGFVDCNPEEERLAHLRKKKYCVPVDSYCSLWCNVPYRHVYCITRKNSYCCFKGKLARLIQVEGRKQLGISWGSAKHPDCRGLTMSELSRIDFSKIDFSEIHPDVLKGFKKHDPAKIKARMTGMVRKQISSGPYKKEVK